MAPLPNSRMREDPRGSTSHWLSWVGPLLYLLCVGAYLLLRYEGRWAEADSTTFTQIIGRFIADSRVVPSLEPVYPNGFSYQAISAFVIGLTGLELLTLQQLVYPLLAGIVVLPAWLFYREVTGSVRGASLATALLVVQPEFLFVILRSSHEKFTRTFMLTALYLLVRSFKLADRPAALGIHIALFYLVCFAFIVGNNLLAHSFIFALIVALSIGALLERPGTRPERQRGRLIVRMLLVSCTCLVLVYLTIFYLYPPARHDLEVIRGLTNKVAALLLDVQETGGEGATNAYTHIQNGWRSLQIYFMVSIANWIGLGLSFTIWSWQAFRWIVLGRLPRTQGAWLLWLLYAAFMLQGALSVLADASGSLGSNLQHRLFPSFSLVAVGIVGAALASWEPPRLRRPIGAALAIGVAGLALLSVFKATNEPSLSNKWTFYRAEELTALYWADAHLRDAEIWNEYDERLSVAFYNTRSSSLNRNLFLVYQSPTMRYVLVSPLTRMRGARLGQPLPLPPDSHLIYDNGGAELYQIRPRTPFQH